jgi:hypothetical protein
LKKFSKLIATNAQFLTWLFLCISSDFFSSIEDELKSSCLQEDSWLELEKNCSCLKNKI